MCPNDDSFRSLLASYIKVRDVDGAVSELHRQAGGVGVDVDGRHLRVWFFCCARGRRWSGPEVNGNTLSIVPPVAIDFSSSAVIGLYRVPHYTDVTVPSGTTLSSTSWDGSVGGVLVFRATGDVSIEGDVDASAMGFDLGVFLAVLGAVLLSLESFSRMARRSGDETSEHAMDIDPSRDAELTPDDAGAQGKVI